MIQSLYKKKKSRPPKEAVSRIYFDFRGFVSSVMQSFVLFTLACAAICIAAHDAPSRRDAVLTTRKPQIYYCRSPNMETFTCWWHPLENASDGNEKINYTFTYTIENEHLPRECPDYVTGGAHSCYFDMTHTRVWEVYCMNITASTSRGTFTSPEHCIDVADIVEIDPPFNLTYTLMNDSEGESGRTAQVSWSYPIPSLVHIGWITLVYELRFRSTADPGNWKVKGLLREPQLELLDLPAGNYEVMVRCRSKNNNIWSQWSAPLIITIPSANTGADRMLALILITGVGVMAVLIIGFGIIPQSKRIKALLLPPIPKPRIRGLDPLLLRVHILLKPCAKMLPHLTLITCSPLGWSGTHNTIEPMSNFGWILVVAIHPSYSNRNDHRIK
ncbi:hypothetical protein ACEWY4_016901 [Coilia grayii]|uniref:Fibronectin type-III domain-containing protein n=1 Tax=Coilia grayii TaxID=363190 RepID=A0ABD1JLP1_9TELE